MRPAGIYKSHDLMTYISRSTDFGLWPDYQVLRMVASGYFTRCFDSTAYLKFAKLQYVSSGFRCRLITGH